MERYLQWFNERTTTEKLLLVALPFLVVGGIFFAAIKPLLDERRKLEQELARLRDVLTLVAKKRQLEEELERLKKTEKLLPVTFEEIHAMAERNGVEILEVTPEQPKTVRVSFKGDTVRFAPTATGRRGLRGGAPKRGKETGFTARLEAYTLKVVGDEKKIMRFLEEVASSKMVLVGGLYAGCGQADRAGAPISVCELSDGEYGRLVCREEPYPARYALSFIIVNVGE
ncbi:MAG: type II secretion system protein M [Aquificae bacterium]|nr:type II secretion system protein M [Aquificota bacterium]